ncbi:ATP-NAD kinase family protein [Halomicroarcula sp. GCM10025709]|uniref:ATP-NAD kinase family protein n=1 Tax=Haloarcula TaxID=2237 RepID=UPI0024C2C12E|nr:ATP-NAD kinase family protein [Halomicroarcula sp. YJ-61-S]
MRRIGVVVNPIAGMGGRVGLKGTDGKVEEARRRGAEPRAPARAREALDAIAETDTEIELLACGGPMGAGVAREAGFDSDVVATPADPERTTGEDTHRAVRAFIDAGVDAVLFVGGDGTAVDVATAIDEAGVETPMLGVPAGVKVYSSVFGVTPRAAGHVVATFTDTERAEVNDIDEDAFRGGEVVTELRAVATVPVADQRQSAKQRGGGSVDALASAVAEETEPGVTYVLGPGSTVGAIKSRLGFDGTALGVDVWCDGEVVVADASEQEILDALGEENVIVVSPIGGQGFVFGRGNQQLSPAVIRQSRLQVVASSRKLDDIGRLRVDTGDTELDESLAGWLRVRVGRYEQRLVEVVG